MFNILKLQFKNSLRDKIIIISICLPIITALILKFHVPAMIFIEPELAVLEGNISKEVLVQLSKVANISYFNTFAEVESRVLESTDEVIGILFDIGKEQYNFILEGNERAQVRQYVKVVGNRINHGGSLEQSLLKVIPNNKNEMLNIIITLTILMALYMGSTFIAFTIVQEKEDGITNINKVLPMTMKKYLAQKILLGLLGTVAITFCTSFILISGKQLSYLILFLAVSAVAASSLGLFIGALSKDLISAIVSTKVVLLVFIFMPFISFLMPIDLGLLKNLFYLIPSYPIFEGIMLLLNDGDVNRMLLNMLVIVVHITFAYYIFFKYNEFSLSSQ